MENGKAKEICTSPENRMTISQATEIIAIKSALTVNTATTIAKVLPQEDRTNRAVDARTDNRVLSLDYD